MQHERGNDSSEEEEEAKEEEVGGGERFTLQIRLTRRVKRGCKAGVGV